MHLALAGRSMPTSRGQILNVISDTADAFVLPQYGAVAILNPPPSSQTPAYNLPRSAMAPSFHLFTQHLYSLLALPPIPAYIHPCPPPSPMHPPSQFIQCITPWQIDQIMRVRAAENSAEARKTLAGIIRLVSRIKEMKVGDGVRGEVLLAVEKMELVGLRFLHLLSSFDARCSDGSNYRYPTSILTRQRCRQSGEPSLL